MVECWICGRAMVADKPYLPWPICDRANCKEERDILQWRMSREHTRQDYEELEKYA